jgi:peptidoglycan hydrolase CwlO-like protein
MDSKDKIILEISSAVQSLSQKIESLQAKVNELCKSTGNCSRIKEVHKDLLPQKEEINGININPLCKEE